MCLLGLDSLDALENIIIIHFLQKYTTVQCFHRFTQWGLDALYNNLVIECVASVILTRPELAKKEEQGAQGMKTWQRQKPDWPAGRDKTGMHVKCQGEGEKERPNQAQVVAAEANG